MIESGTTTVATPPVQQSTVNEALATARLLAAYAAGLLQVEASAALGSAPANDTRRNR